LTEAGQREAACQALEEAARLSAPGDERAREMLKKLRTGPCSAIGHHSLVDERPPG
jgi:hypothetical protein